MEVTDAGPRLETSVCAPQYRIGRVERAARRSTGWVAVVGQPPGGHRDGEGHIHRPRSGRHGAFEEALLGATPMAPLGVRAVRRAHLY